jgi:hypothetical protein
MTRTFSLAALLSLTTSAACVGGVDPPVGGDPNEDIQQAASALTTKECIADNDWKGTNPCVLGSSFDPPSAWNYSRSSGYTYGDMRYTTASDASAWWGWNKPASNSSATVYVYIPSRDATATVEYTFGCSNEQGTAQLLSATIDQSKYSNEWVPIGTTGLGGVDQCDLYMSRADGGTTKMAMDAAKLVTVF